MQDNHSTKDAPPAADAGLLWFLDTLVAIRVSCTEGSDGLSVIEHRVLQGDSPPLHSHLLEDEFFHILEGEFRVQLGDRQRRVGPGAMFLVPKGAIHSYRAESKAGGRFVTVTRGPAFEGFVRALSRPAARCEPPPPAGPPTPETLERFQRLATEHGIVLHGPPLR